MTDIVRRALLGDKQAQEECTRKGIVLPCWRCGGEAEAKQVSNVGRPLYAVSCKKHYCGAYGCAHRTENEAISYWNTRSVPPIGRCKDCKHKKIISSTIYCDLDECAKNENDFCSDFKPKEDDGSV
ncbi:Lar family restriction alleviation protein [Subdoligranulum variabile]|uniref:Lar family restriction alleviation protein n=1 Tax=Subdoligranulum variabile TaxID=214851 RepID=UPI00164E74BF|nr:Lar family restriction alleviation protein [Subdoligranulum variabile]UWP68706.1 Lar family restriction alleviation protein [Subdoligranulum variabile]